MLIIHAVILKCHIKLPTGSISYQPHHSPICLSPFKMASHTNSNELESQLPVLIQRPPRVYTNDSYPPTPNRTSFDSSSAPPPPYTETENEEKPILCIAELCYRHGFSMSFLSFHHQHILKSTSSVPAALDLWGLHIGLASPDPAGTAGVHA
jgi:hypothetical protein